jgi:protochlorophyllide reductase
MPRLARGLTEPPQAKNTGVVFNTLYPGCVAETALFRDAPKLFQQVLPRFQKNITKGYVSQLFAGERVAQVVAERDFAQSGAHWSSGNRRPEGAKPFAQYLSTKANNISRAGRLWELSASDGGSRSCRQIRLKLG